MVHVEGDLGLDMMVHVGRRGWTYGAFWGVIGLDVMVRMWWRGCGLDLMMRVGFWGWIQWSMLGICVPDVIVHVGCCWGVTCFAGAQSLEGHAQKHSGVAQHRGREAFFCPLFFLKAECRRKQC
eukprot:1152400-Pelagomonas_calceolata.AAC.5